MDFSHHLFQIRKPDSLFLPNAAQYPEPLRTLTSFCLHSQGSYGRQNTVRRTRLYRCRCGSGQCSPLFSQGARRHRAAP
ncbi:hypothetical protein SBA5_470028 [Candidatus Sulfotelmatomonas gaucii]|uniref:Uncharacterized protein n=1 Tax=Candidatus Sulfuritelmatomonas gaucii TaxID=2043161 RepID=A0A2N9LNT5_9BACT|nr:hypothetical protein SBA5_470028 [Candidatus Sulfotelmatomonas gaucii]